MGALRAAASTGGLKMTSKPAAARIAFVAAFLALALAAVPVAFAGKPSGGGGGGHKGGSGSSGSSTLTLKMVQDLNGDGLPNFDDTISFNISTTATAYPYVSVRCYQNGVMVYSADAGFYPSYPWPGAQNMPLYSPSWTGGAASCTATLNDTLATLSFNVAA
jgi:hypothetical protein